MNSESGSLIIIQPYRNPSHCPNKHNIFVMAKWADYLISGVWFQQDENHQHLSHVNLHVDSDSNFSPGKKMSKEDVIASIERGKTVATIRWVYQNRSWSRGALVEVYHLSGNKYLRTIADANPSDNLDNMLPTSTIAP